MKRGGGALLSRRGPSTTFQVVPLPIRFADREDEFHRTRVHLRDSQMKRTQPVTRRDPSGLRERVDR